MKDEQSSESGSRAMADNVAIAQRAEALCQLYEISKVLTLFAGVSETVLQIIEIIGRSLPLRSVIFLLQSENAGKPPLEIIWSATGTSGVHLRAAKRNAKALYGYLVGAAASEGMDRDDEDSSAHDWEPTHAINLPLVVAHRPIVGALHLDGLRPFDEQDLIFINTAVNQLAIAINRQDGIDRMRAATEEGRAKAERAERRQRFLADASVALSSSLEYRETLNAVGRLAVPAIADVLLVDVVGADGTYERIVAAFGDDHASVAKNIKEYASPTSGRTTPQARVMKSGQPIVLFEFPGWMDTIAYDAEHAAVMRAAGIKSMLVVPILARGQVIGALTLATAEAAPHESSTTLALVEDLAHRVAMAVENARLYHQAQQAVLARENVMAVVAHDLRNPLQVILMNLLAMQRDASMHEADKARLGRMQRSAERMIRMIQDLLDTVSIDAHQLSVQKQKVAVAPILDEAFEAVQLLAESKEIQLMREVRTLLPPILADAARIQQVLVNLIGNAVKFTPRGGTIKVHVEQMEGAVKFSVTDNGPGIAERDLPNLFARLWQDPQTASLGTGLGLFIARGIVQAHGGRIWVTSTLGAGSTFLFTIPAAAPV